MRISLGDSLFISLIFIAVRSIQNLTQILNEKRHENNETDYVSGFSQRNLEKLEENVENIIIHYLEIYIRKHVAPKFWKYFKFITNEQQGFQDFQQAVNELYSSFDRSSSSDNM